MPLVDVARNVYRLRPCGCVRPLHGRCRHEWADAALVSVLIAVYLGIAGVIIYMGGV